MAAALIATIIARDGHRQSTHRRGDGRARLQSELFEIERNRRCGGTLLCARSLFEGFATRGKNALTAD
jgi:hypothetical protein